MIARLWINRNRQAWSLRCAATLLVAAALFVAAEAPAAELPEDVLSFVEERQTCDHFRGEGSDDKDRQAEIDAALDRYCTGTDARLAALRLKYRDQSAVVEALEAFEDRIE